MLSLLLGGDPEMLARQPHRPGDPMPFAITAAMTERPAHRQEHVRGHRTSVEIPCSRDAAHAETSAVYCGGFVSSLAQFPALAAFLAGAASTWPDLRISADDLIAICDAEDLSPLAHRRLAVSSRVPGGPTPCERRSRIEHACTRARSCCAASKHALLSTRSRRPACSPF